MIDHRGIRLAVRARAKTLSVATTGSTSLGVTAAGYTRAAGSFITDGFVVGMEVTASGFTNAANNGFAMITGVSALLLSVIGVAANGLSVNRALVTEAAAAGRTVLVGLPALRAWENLTFSPVPGRPHVREQYIPGPTAKVTLGPLGELELLPQYAPHIHVPADTASDAADEYADAVLNHFAPGTALTIGNGDVLRVRGDAGPFRSQLQQGDPGYAVVPITIPMRLRTQNAI